MIDTSVTMGKARFGTSRELAIKDRMKAGSVTMTMGGALVAKIRRKT